MSEGRHSPSTMARKTTIGSHPYTKLAQLEQKLIDAAMKYEVAVEYAEHDIDAQGSEVEIESLIRAARRVRKWRERFENAGV